MSNRHDHGLCTCTHDGHVDALSERHVTLSDALSDLREASRRTRLRLKVPGWVIPVA